jgi:hypothetical protein
MTSSQETLLFPPAKNAPFKIGLYLIWGTFVPLQVIPPDVVTF